MRINIHRGTHEIGGSCVEIESSGKRLLIDIGLPLDAEANNRKYLPKVAGLDGGDPALLGILISHPHLDHFGLLAHISPRVPVGMGTAARRILTAAAPFMPVPSPAIASGWDYQSERSFDIGPFHITPYLVDHSAYDAYALLIESGGKRIFYSGDFRAHGRKAALFHRMLASPPMQVDALLLEGSSLGRLRDDQQFPTEADIEEQFVKAFLATTGLALVHTSGQNIDRIVSIFRASKRTGRKLVIDIYTAAILEASGKDSIPQSDWKDIVLFIPYSQRIQIKKNFWFDLLKRHASNRIYIERLKDTPEKFAMLFRPLHQTDLERGQCLEGTAYLYSQWEGYWENGSYDKLKKWLVRHNIPKQSIHTSGHASISDLKALVTALAPRKVIPIHSFKPLCYPKYFTNVEIHDDGEWWEV